MTTITIPNNIEDATSELTGIESLLTAQGWARCAIIASFVWLDSEGGDQTTKTTDRLSPAEFAALKIAGLKSAVTVRKYVRFWLTASGGRYPLPGEDVDLPAMSFPPPFILEPDTEPESEPTPPRTEQAVVDGVWRRFKAEMRAPDLGEWTLEHAGDRLPACVDSARSIIDAMEHFIELAGYDEKECSF